jgi:methyl-accepting chemotaxis protein
MDKVTQTNAANAEETAAASEELSAQAEQLRGVVGSLQALVGLKGGQPDGSSDKKPTAFGNPPIKRSFERAKTVAATKPSVSPKHDGHSMSAASLRMGSKPSAKDLIPLESANGSTDDFADFTGSKAA